MKQLKDNLKVFVGVPFLGTGKPCESHLGEALDSLAKQETSVEVRSAWVTPPAASRGRQRVLVAEKNNDIIEAFLKTDCSHVLLLNADCELPIDAIEKLIRLDVDIASGVSPTHMDWNETTVGRQLPSGALKFLRRMDVEGKILGNDHCYATGNFCLLAKRQAFHRYSPDYEPLRYQMFKERKYVLGPELQFFADACDMGFSVRIHGGVYVGHLPEWPLSYIGHEDELHNKMRNITWQKE